MADDSSKTSGQEIDLDNIEVELLIICKNPNSMNQAGSFLTRRGWPTTVLSDISKAVEFIADKKPDYVLISLSHPSPSIGKLPDLVTQTFNTPCIGFIETSDAVSSARLNQVKLRFKMQGQPSGPSIHRTLRKILAERFHIETEDKTADNSPSEKSGGGSSITRVKGAGPSGSEGPGVIIQKSSASLMKNKGAQMIKGSNADEDDSSSTGGMQMFSQGGAEKSGGAKGRRKLSEMGEEDGGSTGGIGGSQGDDAGYGASLTGEESEGAGGVQDGFADGKGPGQSGRKSLKDLGGAEGGAGSIYETSESSGAPENESADDSVDAEYAEYESAEESAEESAAHSAGKPRLSLKDLEGTGAETSAGDMLFGQVLEGKGSAPVTMPTKDLVGLVKRSLFGENGEELTAAVDVVETVASTPKGPQSVLERAVEAAVGRVCQTIENVAPTPLEEIGFVGVFPIESESQPGYLVVVWQAPDQSAREAFFRSCESEINSAFESMSVPGKLQPGFWVQLPPVDFVHWAGAKATFTFKSAHQKREVGVAFFETPGPLPKTTSVDDGQNMHAIPLENISTDHPVTFKAFIHFKNNGRYFLYLRNGRQLQPEQKARLLERQISTIYMKHVDLENFRQYVATAHLCGLIIEFRRAA